MLLLPQREIISYILPKWLESRASDPAAAGFSNLSIICFQSSVVNSTNLRDFARSLGTVTSLTLHGCNKLADDDLIFCVKNCGTLKHLSLENVSISPDFYATAAPHLSHLQSLRTSHPGRKTARQAEYYESLGILVQSCPSFHAFTHYLSGDTERGIYPQVPDSFLNRLLDSCGSRLTKFEINGLSLSSDSVRTISFKARNLEQLVIPIALEDVVSMLHLLGLD